MPVTWLANVTIFHVYVVELCNSKTQILLLRFEGIVVFFYSLPSFQHLKLFLTLSHCFRIIVSGFISPCSVDDNEVM